MKYIIMILLSVMLLFSACNNDGDTVIVRDSSWLGGNEGLKIDFLDGEPPLEVLDNGQESFTIAVEIENKGEDFVPIEEASFILKGIQASDLNISPEDMIVSPSEDIEPRKKNQNTGNAIDSPSVFITFPELRYLPDLAGNSPKDFFVEACYSYDTHATTDLCIKKNLRDSTDTKICTIAGDKEFQNSGAPVQVTSMSESGSGLDSIRFSFKINHVNTGGALFQLGTNCLDIPQNEERVEVRVNVPSFDSGDLTCNGLMDTHSEGNWSVVGIKNIQGGASEVYCILKVPEEVRTDGVVTADILISYDYSQTVSKRVLITSVE